MLTQLEPLKRHQDVRLPRSENAGIWLLKLESFSKWRDSDVLDEDGYVFCCYGIPGAGKTVIRYCAKHFYYRGHISNILYSSVVIDDLRSRCPDIGVACLYADYKDQANQTLYHILGTFLRQLLTTAQEPIPDEIIEKLRSIQREGGRVGDDNLPLLKIRLNQLERAFICIDAVDELESKVRRQLLNALKELSTNNTRLFLTGRSHMKTEVQECFQATGAFTVTITANERDIETFVRQQIRDDPDPDAIDEVLERDIIGAIIKKSQGM